MPDIQKEKESLATTNGNGVKFAPNGDTNGQLDNADNNIGKIREILFGTQMRDLESGFRSNYVELSRSLAALETVIASRLDDTKTSFDDQLSVLGRRSAEQVEMLKEEVAEAIKGMEDRLSQEIAALRQACISKTSMASLFEHLANQIRLDDGLSTDATPGN